jgi:hypothetical protein
MTSLSKKGPVYKQKSHGIEVAVWKRVNDDGKAFYSVSANRSYRDGGCYRLRWGGMDEGSMGGAYRRGTKTSSGSPQNQRLSCFTP